MSLRRKTLPTVVSLLLWGGLSLSGQAHETGSTGLFPVARPDGHAPIGVMGDHMHRQGEWMISYRYRSMESSGLLQGTGSIFKRDAFRLGYMASPRKMTMEMHGLGLMVAPTDEITLAFMASASSREMTLERMDGTVLNRRTEGLGDVQANVFYRLHETRTAHLHAGMGLSLPTGSIDERHGTMPMAYGMQLGSGTYDLVPSLTALGQSEDFSWGAQAMGQIRLDENDRGYTLGNRFDTTAWTAYRASENISLSLRLAYSQVGQIDGAMDGLNPMMAPGADPSQSGGDKLDGGAGINLYLTRGALQGHRFAFEYLYPLWQDARKIQMEADGSFVLGWQWSW